MSRHDGLVCPAPWNVLYIDPQKDVRLCFEAQGSLGNMETSSLKSIWHSGEHHEIRQQMFKGLTPFACQKCRVKESVLGGQSLRTMLLDQLGAPVSVNAPQVIKHLDIAFGDECNLACRSCSPHYSSRWQREEGLASRPQEASVLSGLLPLPELVHVTMAGGEPWLNPLHVDFLNQLVSLQDASSITLEYNTNASISGQKFFELWRQFKHVKISFSLDATGERFHYMRYPARFSRALEIISELRAFDHSLELTSYTTVSVMNIDHLPDLITTLLDQGRFTPHEIQMHYLVGPEFYNIRMLNAKSRERITQKILDFIKLKLLVDYDLNEVQSLMARLKMMVNYMNSERLLGQYQAFWRETERLDLKRGQSFKDCFPEWIELLTP